MLTLVLGTLLALLLERLGTAMRTALSVALLLAWATPALTATIVWQWIFDARYGVVNWLLGRFGADYEGHSWLSSQLWPFFFVATLVVVWMGVPFVAFTVYAGMTQISQEVVEAAAIDGASAWDRFRDVTWPALKPIFVVLAALSTLWDLAGVHPGLRPAAGGRHRAGDQHARRVRLPPGRQRRLRPRGRRGRGHGGDHAAPHPRPPAHDVPPGGDPDAPEPVAVERRGPGGDRGGRLPRVLDGRHLVPGQQRHPLGPRFLPIGTLENYRAVFERENFWSSFGNSLRVTLLTVAFALVTAFLAAWRSRFRFRGAWPSEVAILLVQMVPAEALMISVVKTLDGWSLRNSIIGLTITYVAFVLPFTVWTLRGFVSGVPRELEEAAMVDGRAGCGRSSPSRCRSWLPASWQRKTSPSSRHGTSSRSPS